MPKSKMVLKHIKHFFLHFVKKQICLLPHRLDSKHIFEGDLTFLFWRHSGQTEPFGNTGKMLGPVGEIKNKSGNKFTMINLSRLFLSQPDL